MRVRRAPDTARNRPRRAALVAAALAVVVAVGACSPAPAPSPTGTASSPPSASPTAAITEPPIDAALENQLPASIGGRPTTRFTSSIDKVGRGDITIICTVFCPEAGLYATQLGANPHTATYGFAWTKDAKYALAAIRIPNADTARLPLAWANARFLAARTGGGPALTPPPDATPSPAVTPPNVAPPTRQIGGKQFFVVGTGAPRFDLVYPRGDVLFMIPVQNVATVDLAAADPELEAIVAAIP